MSVSTVGVIGAGVMCSGIAQVAASIFYPEASHTRWDALLTEVKVRRSK